MKEMKVSAIVGLAVTVLAVVTAAAFSVATVSYQREVVALKKANAAYQESIEQYRVVLEGIKEQLARAGFNVN